MSDPTAEYGPPIAGVRWPARGTRGSFGFRRSPSHMHQGVDLQAPEGTPWLAVADGTIEHVVTAPGTGFAGYGKVVVLAHRDRATGRLLHILYGHGQSVTVARGAEVTRGQELGKVGRTQYARRPTRPEGSMGPHLHLEVSTHAYPQGPEARTRLDPAEVLGGRVPERELPARADAGPIMAKRDLRVALMARLIRTDLTVARVQRELTAAGYAPAAALLGSVWTRTRGELLPLLSGPSRLETVRAAVMSWLERIDETARQAAAMVPALAARAEAVRVELRRIWEDGVDWTTEQVEQLRDAVVRTASGAGSLLTLVLIALALSRSR